jgi:hypothetical protein
MPTNETRTQAAPVTVDNFTRAERDMYFASCVKQAGGVGKFFHNREIVPIDQQTVVRANRDTLYSWADAGPVTVTLPMRPRLLFAGQAINQKEPHYNHRAGGAVIEVDSCNPISIREFLSGKILRNEFKSIRKRSVLREQICACFDASHSSGINFWRCSGDRDESKRRTQEVFNGNNPRQSHAKASHQSACKFRSD